MENPAGGPGRPAVRQVLTLGERHRVTVAEAAGARAALPQALAFASLTAEGGGATGATLTPVPPTLRGPLCPARPLMG